MTVEFTATATNEGTGVDRVMLYIQQSFSSGGTIVSPILLTDEIDSFSDGVSSRTYEVDEDSPAGSYSITGAQVWDKAGNSTYYSASELEALGIDTRFEISSNVSPDDTAPILTSLNLPDIDLSDGPESVTITATATDEGTGVDRVMLYIQQSFSSGGTIVSPILLTDGIDSFSDGVSSRAYVVDEDSPAGSYSITGAQVWDKAGNSTYYSANELEALGIDTQFSIAGNISTTGSGDDYVSLDRVSMGGQLSYLDGGLGHDTLDASNIFAGSWSMQFRCYDVDVDFAGYDIIQFADYQIAGFEVVVGSELGSNWFFIPHYTSSVELIGGNFDDFFFGSWDNADRFFGLGGNDEFRVSHGDEAYGGTGDDIFELSLLYSGREAGWIDGQSGTDLLNASFGATIDLGAKIVITANSNTCYIVNVENVQVSAWRGYATSVDGDDAANHFFVDPNFNDGSIGVVFDGRGGGDTLDGSAGRDSLSGGAGNDVIAGFDDEDSLFGGAGWDTLDGGVGDDILDGGNGTDTASYASASAGVTVSLALTEAQDTLGAGLDTLVSIENLSGSDFSDTLSGDANANTISGGFDADTLYGDGAGDTLRGDDGNDTLHGGNGWDNMHGGDGDDTLWGGNGGDLMKGSTGNDTFHGEAGYDRIYGESGADTAWGGGDTDLIYGQAGDDVLYGEAGDDTLAGANGRDTLDGGDDNDVLDGGAMNDVLIGGAGDDVLIGSWGLDTLTGGTGADTFAFEAGHSGRWLGNADIITDFSQEDGDVIDLSAIDAVSGGDDDAFTFTGGSEFTGVAGELITFTDGEDTFVAGDVNGDGVADFQIRLEGLYDLTAGDFVL